MNAAVVARFTAYATALSRLTPAAWERLAVRCAALDDPSAAALIERALLAAKPFELRLPEAVRERLPVRAITGATRAFITGSMLAYEVWAEFGPRFDDVPRVRTRTSGKPDIDAMVDASMLIHSTMMRRNAVEPLGAGLIAALRAAAVGVQMHDIMPPENFVAAYAIMETEIPFSSVDSA